MSTLPEIEQAIEQLPPEQFAALADWIVRRREEAWDQEMEEDAKSGRLDGLYARLEKENAGEPEVALDDFLHQSELPKTL